MLSVEESQSHQARLTKLTLKQVTPAIEAGVTCLCRRGELNPHRLSPTAP